MGTGQATVAASEVTACAPLAAVAGDSQFPSQGTGRDVTRVQSFGCLKVVVDVTLQGMEELGYSVAPPQQSTVRLGLAS